MSRWLRCLICLALICCILVNCSPLRVEATGAGVAAATITGAATVTVSAPIAIGAAVIALGIAAGTNDDFQRLVDTAVSNAGDWVKDGTVELLQTINSAGEKAYYAAGEMLDDLRSWVYDSSVVYESLGEFASFVPYTSRNGTTITPKCDYVVFRAKFYDPVYSSTYHYDIVYLVNGISYLNSSGVSKNAEVVSVNGISHRYVYISTDCQSGICTCFNYGTVDSTNYSKTPTRAIAGHCISQYLNNSAPSIFTQHDLTLGYLPSSDTTLDDKTVVTFHPYLAHVLETRQSGGSGGSGDDGNNNKWWLRLALGASAAAVYATTQQQQIENPSTDIQEITFGVQFDVTDTTEEDQKKILYVSPQTGTIPGTGTDSGTGTDPGGDSGSGGNTGTDTGSGSGGNTGWVPPSDHSLFALGDLSKFFPFCIPFDLFDFFTLLNADPVAPVFSWEIEDLSGQTYSLTIDLAEWDPVALLFRRLQLFLFICGLAAASRKFIKW